MLASRCSTRHCLATGPSSLHRQVSSRCWWPSGKDPWRVCIDIKHLGSLASVLHTESAINRTSSRAFGDLLSAASLSLYSNTCHSQISSAFAPKSASSCAVVRPSVLGYGVSSSTRSAASVTLASSASGGGESMPAGGEGAASGLRRELYPPTEPRVTGRLRVSDVHELYWEECGNPNGRVRERGIILVQCTCLAETSRRLSREALRIW